MKVYVQYLNVCANSLDCNMKEKERKARNKSITDNNASG